MANRLSILNANTIVYCRHWQQTVEFYRERLQLPVTFSTDWFLEFQLTDTARLSVVDERRARIKSAAGQGITLTWQVQSIEQAWQWLHERGLQPEPIKKHPWGARVFYFYDPEGHRLELWSENKEIHPRQML